MEICGICNPKPKKKKRVKASSNDYDPLEGTSSDHLLPAEEDIPADSHYLLSRSETCVGFGYAQVTGPHRGFITRIAEPYPANANLSVPPPLISYSSLPHPSIQIPSSPSQSLHCHLQHHSPQVYGTPAHLF